MGSMKILMVLFAALLVFGCLQPEGPANETPVENDTNESGETDETGIDLHGFCGWSTNGSCNESADCMVGGCSGQVCHSDSGEAPVTTCEWRDCYDADAYNVTCGCVQGECRWH
ncbi:eight-cysteine-cluster domain-containing protein [Candidatus Micrarchaeota archaeon]|nr:eight-cysteine-cluster domain-containing protein [Candidatus Micrarchaeota archaeon]